MNKQRLETLLNTQYKLLENLKTKIDNAFNCYETDIELVHKQMLLEVKE